MLLQEMWVVRADWDDLYLIIEFTLLVNGLELPLLEDIDMSKGLTTNKDICSLRLHTFIDVYVRNIFNDGTVSRSCSLKLS